jgi:hypothetical protein
VDLTQILNTLKGANISWFFISSCSFGSAIFMTGIRAKVIIGQSSNSFRYFLSNSVSSLAMNVLPSRLGEISYPLMWKKYCNVPTSKGTATWITIRVYDALILMLTYLIGFTLYRRMMPKFFQGWWFMLVLGLFSLFLMSLLYLPRTELWKDKIQRIGKLYSGERVNLWQKIRQWLNSLLEDFEGIYSRKLYVKAFLISCIIIFFQLLFIYSMIRSVGYKLGLHEIILMSFLLFCSKIIQTLGNFGPHEAGIAGALILLGIAKDRAISIAVSTHLLQLVPMVIFALFSYVILLKLEEKVIIGKTSDTI